MDCTLRVGLPEDDGFRLLVQWLQEGCELAWVRQVSNRHRRLAVMRRDEEANLPTGRRTKMRLNWGKTGRVSGAVFGEQDGMGCGGWSDRRFTLIMNLGEVRRGSNNDYCVLTRHTNTTGGKDESAEWEIHDESKCP